MIVYSLFIFMVPISDADRGKLPHSPVSGHAPLQLVTDLNCRL